MLAKLRGVFRLDADIVNAVYLTPHFWTEQGRSVDSADVVQPDLARWTYRNQVQHAPGLSPRALFALVKLTEALFHLRPRALLRLVHGADARVRRILRASLTVGARVIVAEVAEFVRETSFVAPGSLDRVPGAPEPQRRRPGHARYATSRSRPVRTS
jgi:anaerobic magnesium-protoporphyrin IX monomethyl ester cyclase